VVAIASSRRIVKNPPTDGLFCLMTQRRFSGKRP